MAKTTTLKFRGEGIEEKTLAEMLSKIDADATVADGKITVSESKVEEVKAILAEIGLEVLEDNAVTASTDGAELTHKAALEACASKLDTNGFSVHLTATDKNTSWLFVDGLGTPVAQADLSDQDNKAEISRLFASDTFKEQLETTIESSGALKVLSAIKAKVITAAAIAQPEEVNVKAHVDSELTRFKHCQGMALTAATKNMFQHTLKETMMESLVSASVPNPEAVVEAAFAALPEFMQTIEAKTVEYMALDDSGLQATENMLEAMSPREMSDAPVLTATATKQRAALTQEPATLDATSIAAKAATVQATTDGNDLRAQTSALLLR